MEEIDTNLLSNRKNNKYVKLYKRKGVRIMYKFEVMSWDEPQIDSLIR